jgi:hypothetical protein
MAAAGILIPIMETTVEVAHPHLSMRNRQPSPQEDRPMNPASRPLRFAAAVLVVAASPALARVVTPGESAPSPQAATAPAAGCAAMAHGDMAGHHPDQTAAPRTAANGLLQLPGQDAFGALQEVVARLDADPATDWRSVNLRALRDHLVDMNELVLNADVAETAVDHGIAATVTGSGRTLAAIRRMLPMHVQMLGMEDPHLHATWREIDGGGVLTVETDDPAGLDRLRGLGFYGVMALGDHHRRHHLAIALGQMHH